MCGFKKSRFIVGDKIELTSESVQGSALSFQSIDNVHGSDSLPLSMFGVCDCISDDIL